MGAARPHAPGFTFGRPKVNRKTAKTKVLDSFILIGSNQWRKYSATESGFDHLIYRGSINGASASGPVKGAHVSLGFSPGVRRTSVFAKGENLGVRRDSFPPRKSNLEGSPGSPQDWLGGFQRGTGVPLCVVAEKGVTGEKPHRKGFSLRVVFW